MTHARAAQCLSIAGLALGAPLRADQISLTPVKDASIYEDHFGFLANGAGEYLFTGTNGAQQPRRALLRFDLSSIPAGATVQQVTLKITVTRTPEINQSHGVSLHRLTTSWSEGPSNPEGEEGGGAPSLPGDATWVHKYYSSQQWATPGGDFYSSPSATISIPDLSPQNCTFGSTPGLIADVQAWVNAPASNYGWIAIGDEAAPGSARRFNSREHADPSTRPLLQVNYTLPDPPSCYPNCDGSTSVPFLNVADFTCFLSKFAAQLPYANCDGSTTAPMLNVADFTCFLTKFAVGCSAP
jgi:hypothetical protein